jgi:tetraprenyl-beta-curcumene synthase
VSTATHTSSGRRTRRPHPAAEDLRFACVFADTVLCYLVRVLPDVRSELAHWRGRAEEIPDPRLRRSARESLAKRGNIEGAALFATLAPAVRRSDTVRALVAFQTAYNYLDALSELPCADPRANAEQLHQALLTALHPSAEHLDYYAHTPDRGDGGYLTALIDACRTALSCLPSFPALAPAARGAAARIVDFQTLNLAESCGGHDGLSRWAADATPPGCGFAWWETAAAAGSSLAVHALIAAAADPGVKSWQGAEIDRAYFPVGALHSLLDSLVDRREDRERGQSSLLGYYDSPAAAGVGLDALAAGALSATARLPNPHAHRVILTAMCSYYLSAPQCDTPAARPIAASLGVLLGIPLRASIAMFRCRRLFHTLTRQPYN